MEKASRVAALYDVHGNLPALEAVLSDIEGLDLDLLVVGGDVASGPMPAEALDRLEAMGDRVRWVRGNADREVVSAYDGGHPAADDRSSDPALRASSWAASRIGDHHRNLMASFEEQILAGLEQDVVVCGHVHTQYDRRLDNRRVVNAGSVGLPYQGEPVGAFWALLGPERVESPPGTARPRLGGRLLRASGLISSVGGRILE
jgi:putative phosphoesterase